jgi:hypothetical protein
MTDKIPSILALGIHGNRTAFIGAQWRDIKSILVANIGKTSPIALVDHSYLFKENQDKLRNLGYKIKFSTLSTQK